MNTYIIAFMTHSESILRQYLITAKNRVEALDDFLQSQGIILEITEDYSVEKITELLVDMDCNISAFQL